MKKLLALVLALVMSMSLVTISNAAFKDADKIDNKEAVEVMNAIGVLVGDDKGNFNADANLTRAQAAKIICVMLLGKDAADGLNLKSTFSDASGWAESYIAYCASQGIVAGVGDGKFDPNGQLTGYQFAKMLLVALGYKADVEGMTGADWQVSVAKLALNADLTKALEISLSKVLTRDEAAQMAFNTLKADMVEYKGGVNVSTSDGTSVVVDSTRSKVDGSATANYNNTAVGDGVMQFCEQYFPKLKLDTSVPNDDFGRPATKWTYNSKDVGVYASKPMATWTTGIEDITEGDLYKALNFSSNGTIDVYENGAANSTTDVTKGDSGKNLAAYKGATIEAYDTDDDNVAEKLVVCYPYLAQVTKVTEATKTADRKVTLKVWNSDDGAAITGVTYETEKFAKDDFVLVYAGDKMATTEAWSATQMSADILKVEAAETVSGKVSSVSGTNGSAVTALTVGGTKYTLAGDKMATNGLTDSDKLVKASSFGFKTTYTLYLSNGYVMGAEGESVATDIANIVYVTAASFAQTDSYGKETYYVQTINLDGTVENVKISDQTNGKDNQSTAQAFAAGFYTKTANASDSKKYDFVPVGAYNSINNTSIYYGTTTTDGAQTMKTDTTKLNLTGASKGYVSDTTRVIFVDGTLGDLTTTMATGAIKQSIPASAKVLLSKDDDGNYDIEAIIVGAKKVSVSDEVVYIDSTAKGSNENGTEYNMYNIETGEKTVITAASGLTVNGFATYSIDEDGVYSFTAVGNPNADNADGVHVLTTALTKKGTLISEDDNTDCNLNDIEAKNAVIINNTGNSDNDSLSLSDLAGATNLAAVAYVDDEVVTCIVVTSITKA